MLLHYLETMKTRLYLLRTWATLVSMLAQCIVAFGGPDTTLLYDTKRSTRHEIFGFDGSDFNRLQWRRNRTGPTVVTIVTNPPGGIGLLIGEAPEGAAIKRVVPDTPAWQGGVREGDLIVEIDAQPIAGVPLHDIALRLRGQIGSEVNLTLSRPGRAETLKVRLRRDVVSPPPDGFRL